MRWWLNRWILVPLAIAAVIGLWNLYVAVSSDGVVAGHVLDPAGRPVANATVILFERSFINQVERARTVTGPDGSFRFDQNRSHLIQLEAQSETGRRTPRHVVRLWFRGQHRELQTPLVLG